MSMASVSLLCLFGILWGSHVVAAPPNSFAHAWPGQPATPFGPDWQDYFEVKDPLPRLEHIALSRSFAGNIPVNRPDHPNNTLFFWAFERQGTNGTLTAPADENNTDPWIIWLQGGPGDSSMLGFSQENGPVLITSNRSWEANPFSWNTLVDVIWMDQPVGTGYSTADVQGYIADEDQMGEDFVGFLTNLVSVFPSLATRPLYLIGESYGGMFISYIVKHIFSESNPPVNLHKVAIGNGLLGSVTTVRELPIINVLETYPAIIGYDEDVFNYFRAQHHLCGFDLNLTYPQTGGTFPTLNTTSGLRITLRDERRSRVDPPSHHKSVKEFASRGFRTSVKGSEHDKHRETKRSQWKRDLADRINSGTLDPWYGCDIFDEMWDYAFNFTLPWKHSRVNFYDIPDATNPEPPRDASPFFNNDAVRAALHAPTSKNWTSHFVYPFNSIYDRAIGNQRGDPSVEPVAFLTPLFANASARGIPFVFYSGNDDSDIPHHGTEVIIQNFTFGGIQGFTKRPATPWFDDDGAFAGIVHQERNLTYVLFEGAGHMVPQWRPAQALAFLREFVLGDNPNGTVLGDGSVVGGENVTLGKEYLAGGNEIFYGSAKTEGTYTIPSATAAAWDQFIATATLGAASVTNLPVPSSKPSTSKNGAAANGPSDLVVLLAAMVGMLVFVSEQVAV
ncbi:alpha/beta-hydrolase [Ganoderma leucocontextum]|nr:alpha/beta-hydrolase [Ganoderma leucocontextum]